MQTAKLSKSGAPSRVEIFKTPPGSPVAVSIDAQIQGGNVIITILNPFYKVAPVCLPAAEVKNKLTALLWAIDHEEKEGEE